MPVASSVVRPAAVLFAILLVGAAPAAPAQPPHPQPAPADFRAYAGTDAHGVPHYTRRVFTPEERALLRAAYGVEEPGRLYLSDSTGARVLKYDTRVKRCRTCYVNSYRIGFISVRRPGESWDALERRVRGMRPGDFPPAARTGHTALTTLDPDVGPLLTRMLADARRAGFRVRVRTAYRTPLREAYLMALGHGRTHTLTSLHSYGRALDVVVGDGNLAHRATRTRWVAFRRWVAAYDGGRVRVLGSAAHTWDWPHLEVPSAHIGFRSIDAALDRARACFVPAHDKIVVARVRTRTPCDFAPHLPTVP